MQGRDDDSAISSPASPGADRYVVDYLADEVLCTVSPTRFASFLERTSDPRPAGRATCATPSLESDRQSGDAREALSARTSSWCRSTTSRRWYRYHHLFADVLQAHLRSEQPELIPALHLRASRWYDGVGEPVPAVRHALAAGAVDGAAELVEEATPALRRTRQEATIRRWLDDVPDEVVQRRPVLAIAFIGALMSSNEFGDVERRLLQVEALLPDIAGLLATGADPSMGPAGGIAVLDVSRAGQSSRPPSRRLLGGPVPGLRRSPRHAPPRPTGDRRSHCGR